MSQELWNEVDTYVGGQLVPEDPDLAAVLRANADAGLPAHDVSPVQGKLLQLLARIQGAGKILEIGTLGGYSTIWLARALPPGGPRPSPGARAAGRLRGRPRPGARPGTGPARARSGARGGRAGYRSRRRCVAPRSWSHLPPRPLACVTQEHAHSKYARSGRTVAGRVRPRSVLPPPGPP